jgi:hypothetical protein
MFPISLERLEHLMTIAKDIKKEFLYSRDRGQWHWFDRSERGNLDAYHGPFSLFGECLVDAVEPYLEGSEGIDLKEWLSKLSNDRLAEMFEASKKELAERNKHTS